MGDVVDLMLVQANRFDEIDLNFIARRDPANKIGAVAPALLRDRENRRDIIARMRVISGQKRVVKIKLAHRGAVRPGGPFRAYAMTFGQTEQCRPAVAQMRIRHRARRLDRTAIKRGDAHRCIVDDPVNDHLRRFIVNGDRIGGDRRDLPGKLVFAF